MRQSQFIHILNSANLQRMNGRDFCYNSLSFSSILTSAELTQQKLESWRSADASTFSVNWGSLSRYAFMGGCVISPMLYTYYCWLDSMYPGTAARTVAKKVASDVLFANIAYYSVYYYGMNYLEHKDHSLAKAEVKKSFGISYLVGMLYWIPVMACNFAYISPKYRMVFIGFATYIEKNGLCLMRRTND